MDILSQYNIVFSGLAVGTHEFEFDVTDDFFAAFEGSEITKGDAKVYVTMTKQSTMMILDFEIQGEVGVVCDRCLEEFMMPIGYDGTLLVKFSEEELESDGEVIWLIPGEGEVNVAQYIYESISLSLPYQRIHPEDKDGKSTCNADMLNRFKIVSHEEFETMFLEEDLERESPSAWEKLAELKDKMEKEK